MFACESTQKMVRRLTLYVRFVCTLVQDQKAKQLRAQVSSEARIKRSKGGEAPLFSKTVLKGKNSEQVAPSFGWGKVGKKWPQYNLQVMVTVLAKEPGRTGTQVTFQCKHKMKLTDRNKKKARAWFEHFSCLKKKMLKFKVKSGLNFISNLVKDVASIAELKSSGRKLADGLCVIKVNLTWQWWWRIGLNCFIHRQKGWINRKKWKTLFLLFVY